MPEFTTVARIRDTFHLADTAIAPDALIERALADAHTEITARLNPNAETEPPDEALVLGETLLAGAHVFRALAAGDAAEQRHVAIGTARVQAGRRFDALAALAALAQDQAWYILAPYLRQPVPRTLLGASATAPVLGEG